MLSRNCYANYKLDIQDGRKSAQIEADIIKLQIAQWEIQPLVGTFNFEHYRSIHQYLFSDLYDWPWTDANSEKGILFCPAEESEKRRKWMFDRLQRLDYLRYMERNNFVDELTDFYCSTNKLHLSERVMVEHNDCSSRN